MLDIWFLCYITLFSAPKLFAKLKMAKDDSTYQKEMLKIDKIHLLIWDDFGLQPYRPNESSCINGNC